MSTEGQRFIEHAKLLQSLQAPATAKEPIGLSVVAQLVAGMPAGTGGNDDVYKVVQYYAGLWQHTSQ